VFPGYHLLSEARLVADLHLEHVEPFFALVRPVRCQAGALLAT
jgi:hypothetical protein